MSKINLEMWGGGAGAQEMGGLIKLYSPHSPRILSTCFARWELQEIDADYTGCSIKKTPPPWRSMMTNCDRSYDDDL